jgi:3-hydroxyacyl-CoA dehydrogenase/enoyl-CoA hydratase/3-hydroxybutyryl-CoA epimerase
MATHNLRLDVGGDGVALLVMDVEGEPVNTLREGFEEEFEQMAARIEGDPGIRAVVFSSGKPDGFIAGADVQMLARVRTAVEGAALSRAGQQALNRFEELAKKKPLVAAIHGPALGGGLEMALACSYRVCSDDRKTQLGLPETKLGLIPGAGGTQRLPRLIGIAQALDIILAGKAVRPGKARKLGLVDEVVPRSILLEVARRRAAELAAGTLVVRRNRVDLKGGLPKILRGIADAEVLQAMALEENPLGRRILFQQAKKALLAKTRGHYPAQEKALEVVRVGSEHGFDAGLAAEAERFGELVVSDVSKQLREIFFATTALKKDSGVDEPGVKGARVEKIGMLGAGLMGAGIASVAVQSGIAVRLKDKDDAGLLRGMKQVAGILDEAVKRRRLTRREREEKLALVTATTGYDGLRDAGVVIEAVFEDLAVKHGVVREVESVAGEKTIFASNTSSIPIGRIAEAAQRPGQVVGMHFFSPVDKMPLLEVIRARQTSPATVATVVALGKRLGKTVIVVNDGPGFYTSRILSPYMNEASHLLAEGAAVDELDEALRDFGFPVGPLQLLDEVGADVGAKVAHVLQEAFGDRMKPPEGFDKLLEAGRLGRKAKKGFYVYGEGKEKGRRAVDRAVYDLLPHGQKRRSPPAAEMAERCVLQMVNEAALCLAEKIVRSPRDGDIGAVFGLGWPPFRGGPFRHLDALGAQVVVDKLRRWQDQFGARFTPAPLLVEMARSGATFYDS